MTTGGASDLFEDAAGIGEPLQHHFGDRDAILAVLRVQMPHDRETWKVDPERWTVNGFEMNEGPRG